MLTELNSPRPSLIIRIMSFAFKRFPTFLWAVVFSGLPAILEARPPDQQPNIIVVFTDDQGYEDLGAFGSKTIRTPHLDQMAAEGLKLTSFYAQPVCGVSRASLLTGCYPIRVAEPGNVKQLHTDLHPEEITIAEVLGDAGYATALIGKWHAGTATPNEQGFDYFFGTPKYNGTTVFVKDIGFRSPILRNDEVVVPRVETWDYITRDYTEEAITWIEEHRDRPFFLYLAHNLPHIPVGASENFKGKSAYGPYGDTIEEIDWSCGEILAKLKELDIDENTLVVFTSDNGPWVETTKAMRPGGEPFIPREHSGSAAPLRGWKMSAWEGGSRVPFLARWPGKIEAGRVSDEILTTMDFLPTFAALAGAELPDRTLDGYDASEFLLGESDESPRDEYLYYTGCLLTGVRVDEWKLVLPRPANPPGTGWWGRMIEAVESVRLFHLPSDPGEITNVAAENPEVVARLQERIEAARAELGDIDQVGAGARFFDEGPRQLQFPLNSVGKARAAEKPAASKYDEFPPTGNLRFTFESGSLEPWKLVEGEAGLAISSQPTLPRWKEKPLNREGERHLSTGSTGDGFSDRQQVVFESPGFRLEGPTAAFLVSGGFDDEDLFVGLFDTKSDERLIAAGGSGGPQMQRIEWDLGEWVGRIVKLRIVDRNTGPWGHLNFDDFSVEGSVVD